MAFKNSPFARLFSVTRYRILRGGSRGKYLKFIASYSFW